MKCYIKNHPRPQLTRTSWVDLNGEWDFSFEGNKDGFTKTHTINVPFTYETKLSGINDETPHDCVWYQKEIAYKHNGNRMLLHFEGVDYHAFVWVNGTLVGEHKGGYARFSFDITKYLNDGANKLVVLAKDSLSSEQPRGKQRTLPENYGCWYVQTTGIWKSVWLEEVPETYIKSLKLTPDLDNSSIKIEYKINEEYKPKAGVELEINISYKDKFITGATHKISAGNKIELSLLTEDVPVGRVHIWEPRNPKLYDVELVLKIDGKPVDECKSYFGLRKVSTQNGQFLINNAPFYQRLILDQGYWHESHLTPPSEEALVEDIDKIMELGYNGVRKHMKIEDERFLYWADVKGFLVWSEMAATYEFTDTAVSNFTKEWLEIVEQNYNHPSIVVWTPFNESWGIRNIKTCQKQQAFTQAIYYLTKSFDSMRPVIVNDGWEHTISDIITLHDYAEEGSELLKLFSAVNAQGKIKLLENDVTMTNNKYTFANGFKYNNQPIIVSEFGGIAFQNGQGWGYGNKVTDEEAFVKRFDAITSAIKDLDYVCGYCYTQVSDVQQEVNGLMDEQRNFKINPAVIKEINCR